jgi:hypothetical protein
LIPRRNDRIVENHGVTILECVEVLGRPGQDFASRSGSRLAYGQTRSGRYLKVVYRPDEQGDGLFVITAYQLRGRELAAYRRRIRRRR